ncbi:MAG TPA: hypothetical protein VE993_04545 [Stellaceae bacterium]|nr:hypothetical protein [Stellaceae bacterium]
MADDQITIKFGASIGGLTSGVEKAKFAIASIREPVDSVISAFDKFGEAIGAAFAIERIADLAKEMAGLSERTRNVAAGIGATPEQFSGLSAAAANAAAIYGEIRGIVSDVRTLFGAGGRIVAVPVIGGPGEPSAAPFEFGHGAGRHPGRGGAGEAARDEEEIREGAELFAAGERLKLALAKGNADQIAAIYNEWLAEVASIYGKDSTQYLNLEREKVEAAQRASEQRIRTLEEEYKKALELGMRQTEEMNRRQAEAQKKLDEEFKHFAAPIERSISDALTNAVLSIRQQGGLREVMLGIEKSLVGGMTSNLVKGLGDSLLKPLFTGIVGQGGFLGGIGNLLFGTGQEATKISLLSVIAANTGVIAGATTTTAASTGTSAVGAGFSAIGAFSGIKSFFGWIGSFFHQGGIVPSAAGGWALPSFAGATPAMLHSREMVLPADLSQGLQAMIRGGGAAQAAVHNHFYGPADGASIGRWFSQNRGDLVAAIRGAWDAGALSFP